MSAESEEIFRRELAAHLERAADAQARSVPVPDPAALRDAAAGHLGASRTLEELTQEYGRAMADRENHTAEQAAAAQAIADELAPVRQAAQIMAGHVPGAY